MARINQIKKRADEDMRTMYHLSRGSYFDVVDMALRGVQFQVRMSVLDSMKVRARMTYYKKSGVMHAKTQPDNTVLVSFN